MYFSLLRTSTANAEHFYYAFIRPLSLRVLFRYVFSISVALSLLRTDALSPSHCLVGIEDPPSRVWWNFWYEPLEWQSFCSGWDTPVCNIVGGEGCHTLAVKRMGREVEFTTKTAFCHLTKKHSRITSK